MIKLYLKYYLEKVNVFFRITHVRSTRYPKIRKLIFKIISCLNSKFYL